MESVRSSNRLIAVVVAVAAMLAASAGHAAAGDSATLPDGSKVNLAQTCPVCGMPVGGELAGAVTYAYRDGRLAGFAGVAAAVFKDGTAVGFEGARCLFIYNTVPKRFDINVDNITRRFVTDFKTGKFIDANNAYLVLGSTVRGPMGFDLIPFATKEAADKFGEEYAGKRVVQLGTVVPKDVERKAEERK